MRVAIFLLFLVSLTMPAATAAANDWITLSQKGYLRYHDRKFDEALALYQAAIASTSSSPSDELVRTDLLLTIAAIHTAMRQIGDAEAILAQVKPTVFKKKYQNQMLQVRYFRRLRALRITAKDFSAAAQAQKEIAKIVARNFGTFSERALDEVGDLANDYIHAGKLTEAINTAKIVSDAIPVVRGKSTALRGKQCLELFFPILNARLAFLISHGKENEVIPVVSKYTEFKEAKHERAASLIALGKLLEPEKSSLRLLLRRQLVSIFKETKDLTPTEQLAYGEALYVISLPGLYSHHITAELRDSLRQADSLRTKFGCNDRGETLQFVQIRSMYCWAMAAMGDLKEARDTWSKLEKRFHSTTDDHFLLPLIQSGNEIALLFKEHGETESGEKMDNLVAELKKKAYQNPDNEFYRKK